MIQTHLWPWNKVKVIKSRINWFTASNVIIMQSLKYLPYTVSAKKPAFFFFFLVKSENISAMSFEYCCENVRKKKCWYMHYLLYLLNNSTNFKLNRIRTQHCQLKMFDITVTLKYSQVHWKRFEQVNLSENYHYVNFDIYLWCLRKSQC